MPRKGISYEQVAKACIELEKNQQLSVRAIQARTGGSMTTVLKHYRLWQRQRSGQQGVETVISDRLRHALLSELEEAAAQSRLTIQKKLQEAQQQVVEIRKESNSKQRRLTQQLQQTRQQKYLLERKKNAAELRASMAEKQLRRAQALLNNQQKAYQKEQRKERSGETALPQIQAPKTASENQSLEQEQQTRSVEKPLQDSPQKKTTSTRKKTAKKVQQSLFDF